MARLKGRERNQHLMLAQLNAGMAAALAADFRSPLPWLFLLPCVISFFWQIERMPGWLASALRYAAWTLVVAAALMVRFFPTNQIFSARASAQLEGFVGYSLLAIAVLFLAGPRVWGPGLTLLPTALAGLTLAAMNNRVNLDLPLILAGPAVFFYLAITALARPEASSRSAYGSQQLLRLGGVGMLVFLIAGGIVAFLPWAQVQVEQAAFQFFNMGVTQYSSLSLESRLGDIEQLLVSSKLVMRVYSSEPQKLRGRVFTQFDGSTWRARPVASAHLESSSTLNVSDGNLGEWLQEIPGESFAIPPHHLAEAAAPGAIRTRIVQSVFNEGLLVAPGGKLLARAPLSSLRLDAFEGMATPLSADVEIYGIVNRREQDPWGASIVQPGEVAAAVLQEVLALPQDTDPRFRELAARLADGSPPEERIRRTVSYVQGAARYSLRVGKFNSHQPAAEFLFEKKRGYCQYFATAAAILLRLEGVPTRYVTGFNVAEGNREGGHYVVRELDAHAWIESYVPGRGWIEADPTPEAEYEALHANAQNSWMSGAREWLAAKWAEVLIRGRSGDWLGAARWLWAGIKSWVRAISWKLLGAALALAALCIWVLRAARRAKTLRARRRAPAGAGAPAEGVAPELADLLGRLDGAWARAGFRRPPWRAPLEHLQSIALSPALREVSRRAVHCYYGARYAGVPAAAAEIAVLRKELDRASVPR